MKRRTMKAKSAPRAALAFVAGALSVSLLACGSGAPAAPHGAPVLLKVYWIAGGAPVLAWTPDDQPSQFLVSPVPPFATEVDFVFDRRLDGNLIEETVTIDGKVTTRPKAMPPIEVQWPGMAERPGAPPLELRVAYNSTSRFGQNTSYVFAKPNPPGFPSSETLTFILHPEGLASVYGEKTESPTTIPVTTAALTVTIGSPATLVPLKYQQPVVFSNRLGAVGATSPFIHVTAGGVDVPYKLLADASMLTRLYVAPADCLGSWPANATLVVTVDAGMPDAFGGKLAQGATGTFKTVVGAAAAGATCAVMIPDGGATDGGATDGATDGGVTDVAPDGGAADAGTDAGAAETDAGMPETDAGGPETDAGAVGATDGITAGASDSSADSAPDVAAD
jgi:hypothetical protein